MVDCNINNFAVQNEQAYGCRRARGDSCHTRLVTI